MDPPEEYKYCSISLNSHKFLTQFSDKDRAKFFKLLLDIKMENETRQTPEKTTEICNLYTKLFNHLCTEKMCNQTFFKSGREALLKQIHYDLNDWNIKRSTDLPFTNEEDYLRQIQSSLKGGKSRKTRKANKRKSKKSKKANKRKSRKN
jgi:hypothetical protein